MGLLQEGYMGTNNQLQMVHIRPFLPAMLDAFPVIEARKALRVMISWGTRFLIPVAVVYRTNGGFPCYRRLLYDRSLGILTQEPSECSRMTALIPINERSKACWPGFTPRVLPSEACRT